MNKIRNALIAGAIVVAPVVFAAPAYADDCRVTGACNYDGWQHGGCYAADNVTWLADLPCIDKFGNWRQDARHPAPQVWHGCNWWVCW